MMETPAQQAKDGNKPVNGNKRWWSSLANPVFELGNRQWWAFLVDLVVSFVLFYALARFTHSAGESSYAFVIYGTWRQLVFFVVLPLAYYPGSWWLFGHSFGMWLMSIRVVNKEMERLSLAQALIRFIAYCLLGLFLYPFLFSLMIDKKARGLHDKLARTFVIGDQ